MNVASWINEDLVKKLLNAFILVVKFEIKLFTSIYNFHQIYPLQLFLHKNEDLFPSFFSITTHIYIDAAL